MPSNPLISVIIDNYNYARFLPDAINSALAQEYDNYEIIVVDDASTDHSAEIILSYGNKIKPVLLERNGGQGAAFNAGFAECRGDLICFLDADDVFSPNKLSCVAAVAAQNPNAILIYNLGYMVDINLKEIDFGLFPKKLMQGDVSAHVLKYSESLFPPTSFLTFRREFLERVLPFTPFLTRIDADFPLQMLAGLMGEAEVVEEPLGFYRLHGNNWFSNNDFIRLDIDTIHKLTRRTEKAFHFINLKLTELNRPERFDPMNHRYHRRNQFMLKNLGWWDYLRYAIPHPNFINLTDKLDYLWFGIKRRLSHF